jgi:hypothetical protein
VKKATSDVKPIKPVRRIIVGETDLAKTRKLLSEMNEKIVDRFFQYLDEVAGVNDFDKAPPVPQEYFLEMDALMTFSEKYRHTFLGYFLAVYAEKKKLFCYVVDCDCQTVNISLTNDGKVHYKERLQFG